MKSVHFIPLIWQEGRGIIINPGGRDAYYRTNVDTASIVWAAWSFLCRPYGTSSLYARKCYGFTHDRNGNLTVDEAETTVVCDIFNFYLKGKSILGIQRELKARGIKSPTGKDTWCKRTIDVMLSNEKYAGDVIIFKAFSTGLPQRKRRVNDPVQHTKYAAVGNHPAIIDKEAFNAVQAEKVRRSNVQKEGVMKFRKSTRYSSMKKNSASEETD